MREKMRKAYWVIKKAKDGQYYFCFVAKNGQIILTSEMYTQKHNVMSAIVAVDDSIVNNLAIVKDKTGEE